MRAFYDFDAWKLIGDIVFSTSQVRVADSDTVMHIAERFRFSGAMLVEVRVFVCEGSR